MKNVHSIDLHVLAFIEKLNMMNDHLVLVHFHIVLDFIVTSNSVKFNVGQNVLFHEEQQFMDLLLLLNKIYVSNVTFNTDGVRQAQCRQNQEEHFLQHSFITNFFLASWLRSLPQRLGRMMRHQNTGPRFYTGAFSL